MTLPQKRVRKAREKLLQGEGRRYLEISKEVTGTLIISAGHNHKFCGT